MELKCSIGITAKVVQNTFNRTAYGIEMRDKHKCNIPSIAFNRTAYGIEIRIEDSQINIHPRF